MIDINKKYRYRNGEEARILCVDRPVNICKVISMGESGAIVYHDSDGHSGHGMNEYDLIEVKEKKEQWLNIYRYDGEYYGYSQDTLQGALSDHEKVMSNEGTLLARVKVTYDEGQFDE